MEAMMSLHCVMTFTALLHNNNKKKSSLSRVEKLDKL